MFKLKIIKEFYDEGYIKVDYNTDQNLVGRTLNIRYYKPNEDGCVEIGGVYLITRFENNVFYARSAPYCGKSSQQSWDSNLPLCGQGSEAGEESELPNELWYSDLSERQEKCFIQPKNKRVRESPPPSLCPLNNNINYPINDSENSFLPREKLEDTQCYLVHDNGGRLQI